MGLQATEYGYTGIVVAAVATFEPIAVLPSALLLGGLLNSGVALQSEGFPPGLAGTMEGVILLCVMSAGLLITYDVRFERRRYRMPGGTETPAATDVDIAGLSQVAQDDADLHGESLIGATGYSGLSVSR